MSNKKIAVIGAGVVVAFAVYKFRNIKSSVALFEYSPAGLKVGFEGITPVLTVKVDIYNPNKTSVPITGIMGKVTFKGSNVGSFVNTKPIIINGMATQSVEFKVRINLFGVVTALTTKDPSLPLSVVGLVKTNFFDLPISYTQTLGGKVSGTGEPSIGFLKKLDRSLILQRLKERSAIRKAAFLAKLTALKLRKTAAQPAAGQPAVGFMMFKGKIRKITQKPKDQKTPTTVKPGKGSKFNNFLTAKSRIVKPAVLRYRD